MASSPRNPKHGIGGPMSLAGPEHLDNVKTQDLIEELKKENNYEPSLETEKRQATLRVLSKAHMIFVREVSRRQGLSPSQVEQIGGKVIPYGSYRLGVFGPGSDIDTLLIAPRHVKRDDFFSILPKVLQRQVESDLRLEKEKPADKQRFKSGITSVVPVQESFVPIIKLVLNGIEIDLIFTAIPTLQTIPPKFDLHDSGLLMGMDQASIRAISGPRVTDEILQLVPIEKSFRTALRAVKLWAQRRAIYANIVGWPGGVAWAMMVARVCQMYPHAIGATIVDKFFFVMKQWNWPTPVMLKDIEQPKQAQVEQGFKVWNPVIYTGDKRNLMPIITPAFPSMCSTYNISKSNKTVILRELARGSQIAHKVYAGEASWGELFKKHTFFTSDHRYYLSLIASSYNPEAAKAWAGLVESKVRLFVMQLDMDNSGVSLARPFTKGFKRVHKCMNEEQVREVQKGSLKYKVEETQIVETTDPELVMTNGAGAAIPTPGNGAQDDKGAHMVYTYSFYIGIDTEAKGSLNLVPALTNLKSVCAGWPNFNPEIHVLQLASIKSWELPDDVFDKKAGEVRPSKPAKKVVKVNKEMKAVRRSFDEVDNSQNDGNATKRPRLMTPTAIPTPTPTPA